MNVGTEADVYIVEDNIRKSYRIPDECSLFPAKILVIIKVNQLINDDTT